MRYLLLAILTSAAIPLVFKYAHTKKLNEAVVITMNYLTITVVMACLLLSNGGFKDWSDPMKIRGALFGLGAGFFFYIGFYLYQRSVRACGATLAGAFGKIGILIPATLSLIIWKEIPTLAQWIGICLAVIAIVVAVVDFQSMKIESIHGVLLIFFLVGGLGDFSTKVFEVYNNTDYTQIFLIATFFSALLWSLPGAFSAKAWHGSNSMVGILVGIPNLLTSYFLVYAMTEVPAVIVFPMFSGGTVMLVSLVSAIAFREKLEVKGYFAIGMIVVALLLIQ